MSATQLTVVMPVYNEEGAIAASVDVWCRLLDSQNLDYIVSVYDDGSKDGTKAILDQVAASNPRVRVTSHANRGHGPTILRGYSEAETPWVFQTDSDNEIAPDEFPELWSKRDDYDFLLGYRHRRESPLPRRIITWVSLQTIRALFGSPLRDSNCPFRLMRTEKLRPMLDYLPPDAFAPNVILSGLASRFGCRIYQHPVVSVPRQTGTVSIVKWKLWKSAARAFLQTLRVALRARPR